MPKHTTPEQRCGFYEAFQHGDTYQEIADRHGVSRECVRYWCRRQRDGGSCQTVYRKEPTGILSHFAPLVRYCILRLRLEHPRWGPDRIHAKLERRRSLRGLALPSPASIGRYLHQWARFRRKRKKESTESRPNPPTEVHQRWQIDFKVDIILADGTAVDLHTVRDPVGEACLNAVIYPTHKVNTRTKRVPMEQARSTLRRCFAWWNTLPDEVQTDGETTLVTSGASPFPSRFTLWLQGLGIQHLVTRSGKPTDNAEVERCHRTINDYAIIGNEKCSPDKLQAILDQSVCELTYDLTSRAEGCAGRTPIEAHPELCDPRRPFLPEHELACFDLRRVDVFLSTFTWTRIVGKTGQICLGGHHEYYCVGRAYARQEVLIRFDPTDRHFVFYQSTAGQGSQDIQEDTELHEIGRRPARNLEIEDLTGLIPWSPGLVPQQLPLHLSFLEGVSC